MRLNKVLVIDGSYLLHRALHVEHIYELTSSKGVGTGGVFQFLRSMDYEVRRFSDYYPMVCWDAGQSERRLKIYPNYKHHEERQMEIDEANALGVEPEVDDYVKKYRDQRQLVMEILKTLGVPSFRFDGWEGDDLMYILSKVSNDCIVMTDDRDLIQLLSPTTRIFRPMADELLEYNSYQSEHHDPDMKKFIIVKSIVGDGSDNIPQCAFRVGEKTAEMIADTMLNNRDGWKEELSQSTKKNVQNFLTEESLHQFDVNMELIDLNRVDVTPDIIRDISAVIDSDTHIPDFFGAMKMVSDLEIQDVDMNSIVSRLTSLYSRGEIYVRS